MGSSIVAENFRSRRKNTEWNMTITERTTVAEIAARYPSSVHVFERFGIDFCCGGTRPVRAACEEQGLSFEEFEQALRAVAGAGGDDTHQWTNEPLHALIDHIVGTYHLALREDLPRLETMAVKVASMHGAKSPAIARIQDCLGELSAELNDHMWKEEQILFRAIRAIEAGSTSAAMPLSGPISVMGQEHDHVGRLLAELRELTDDYVAPVWACETVRALYRGLAELERSIHVHVHLENNVLFPRALRLAGAAHG
jgi:regulator of cell morphogenesis and NO signaling